MTDGDAIILIDYQSQRIRLTGERRDHILQHAEMAGQLERIGETLAQPETVIATDSDETVRVYHRHYPRTPVTSKFLLVIVKFLDDDAFILTAFFSSRQKQGRALWQA